MNASTHTQPETPQPEGSRLRRFTGRHRTLVIAGAAGALLLGGGAVAFAADGDDRSAAPTDGQGNPSAWDDDRWDDDWDDDFQVPEGALDRDAAAAAAQVEVPGDVRDVDLEGTPDHPVWEIDLTDEAGAEWDLYIDALTGEVLHVEADDDSDDDDDDDRFDDDRDDDDGDDD